MQPTFNLVHEPWIPCLDAGGRRRELGLRETLARAHELRAVEAASPLETAALYRLLLAVLQRVYAVPGAAAWWALWQAGRWDPAPLATYLEAWQARFDLFHPERPFYQAKTEKGVACRSVAFLVPGLSAAAFYNHEVDTGDLALPPAAAARVLLAAQAFSFPGICHPQLGLFFNGAPWSAGLVFLVEGDNLFQTLALNLLPYAEGKPLPDLGLTEADRPAWESEDPFAPPRQVPHGYLDYLTWQNRRVWLLPEESEGRVVVRRATATPGLKVDLNLRDPAKHYRDDPKYGWRVLLLDEHRALWRDSSALLSLRHAQVRPPVALSWVAELAERYDLDHAARYRLLGTGLLGEQAKAFLFRAERLPLPLAYLKDEQLVAHLATAVDAADSASRSLGVALWRLATAMLSRSADHEGGRQPDKKDIANLVHHWGGGRAYWAALEVPFLNLVEDLPVKPAAELLVGWRQTLRRAAFSTLERTATGAGSGAAALKGAAQAQRILARQLSDPKPVTAVTP